MIIINYIIYGSCPKLLKLCRKFDVELERVENNKAIYKDRGKTITVIREYSLEKDINFSAVLETLVRIIEQEDKDMQANEKGN